MSLINEALKKAQRQRTEEPAGTPEAPVAATARIAKRGKATPANTLVLIGSGAVALIVLSVVATVFWVNRPAPTPAASTPAPQPAPAAPAGSDTPAPVVVAHLPAPAPVASASVAPAAETPRAQPAAPSTAPDIPPAPVPAPAAAAASSPSVLAATTPPPAAVPAPVPEPPPAPKPAAPNERVTAFVEAVRVTGIRSSGTESKVLMNERVYRVNDIVDRTLNLRLTKVAPEGLTFTDANGVTYVKNF